MQESEIVILGGGMVAGYAAKELVERGLKPGNLAIQSSDTSVPYERPPLSKGFLAGEDQESKIRINPEDFYDANGIELRLKTEIVGVDTRRRVLALRSGEEWGFEKLVIATGATVRKLEVPGGDLPGVHYLRSLDDSKRIRDHAEAENAKRAVVIGSGFIGMEVASVLAQKGIETILMVREGRIWPKVFTPSMSARFEQYFTDRGVLIVKNTEATGIEWRNQTFSVANNGDTLEGDLVVVGIGVRPVTDVAQAGGIAVDNGVLVNEFLEASVSGIYAAGDVANYEDKLFGVRRRVEHWDNAVSQGQHCARTLMGDRRPFLHVPYFFSDVFDLSYELWGDPSGATEVIERGDLRSNSFSVWWLKGNRLVAAFVMNRPDEERNAAPQWIETKRPVTAAELTSNQWPSK